MLPYVDTIFHVCHDSTDKISTHSPDDPRVNVFFKKIWLKLSDSLPFIFTALDNIRRSVIGISSSLFLDTLPDLNLNFDTSYSLKLWSVNLTKCFYLLPCHAKPSQARPGQARPSQAKPSQSVNWGAETFPYLLAIPAFDRIAGLSNRHLNSNRGLCLR